MGSFYVNFATRGPDQDTVAKFLRTARRKAFVSSTIENVTMFYDEESDTQDDSIIVAVGKQASKELRSPVLAIVNHDDDILAYWLFESGNCIDEYNSCPGYFSGGEETPSGGDAKKLCEAFAVPAMVKEVDEVLRKEDYVFAQDRHMKLAGLLKHPLDYLVLGYNYINEEEAEIPPEFIRVE